MWWDRRGLNLRICIYLMHVWFTGGWWCAVESIEGLFGAAFITFTVGVELIGLNVSESGCGNCFNAHSQYSVINIWKILNKIYTKYNRFHFQKV